MMTDTWSLHVAPYSSAGIFDERECGRMSREAERLGNVQLRPDGPIVAGSISQWVLQYTVGASGIDDGGTIILARRFASDWDTPQFDKPTEPNYTTVSTSGAAVLKVRFDRKAHERPWLKCLVIDVYDGTLEPGDTVTIVLGNQQHGSPGIRAQTFQEAAHKFRLLVDPTNAYVTREVPRCPSVPVVADQPIELVCIVPTQTTVRKPVRIFVAGRDQWGNPTAVPAPVQFSWIGDAVTKIEGDHLVFADQGSGHVFAQTDHLSGVSNPITASNQSPRFTKYWADLHAQSGATVGTGTEAEYFTFGRDHARLDVMSHQGNDFQMTDEDWRRLNDTVREFHKDNGFVVLPGYEWSANTSAGGDRNIFYREEDLPICRSSHWQVPNAANTALTPAYSHSELCDRLFKVGKEKVVMGAHVGGRYADIRNHFNNDLCRLVEVASCWGIFEWLLWDAFDLGYIVGVMCNSDGHKGRPGAESPGAGDFGIWGGLTCILAEELTRSSIFEALKNRRCYGTTGPRIDLSVTVGDAPMGTLLDITEPIEVCASVIGVGPLEMLELFAGQQRIAVTRPTVFAQCSQSRLIRVSWCGARARGRERRVTWDGSITLQGAKILKASAHAFDTLSDYINLQDSQTITFRSRTMGDVDGIDLLIEPNSTGELEIQTQLGNMNIDLAQLDGPGVTQCFDGLDTQIHVRRYPEEIGDWRLSLTYTHDPPHGATTPYFIKATQCDGHMAWSSPVYVTRTE